MIFLTTGCCRTVVVVLCSIGLAFVGVTAVLLLQLSLSLSARGKRETWTQPPESDIYLEPDGDSAGK
jgi:hypothetical protein